MIAVPGRAEMLNRARLFGLPIHASASQGCMMERKSKRSQRKKDKIGRQLLIY